MSTPAGTFRRVNESIVLELGPKKDMLLSLQIFEKSEFSDKNPYPG